MIDQSVENLAKEFVVKIKGIAPPSFAYELDESILSLNVLDLYFDARFYKASDEDRLKDILTSSAYAGICIYKVFFGFNQKAKLTLSTDKETKILLKVTDGPFIAKEPVSINLIEVFLKTLLEPADKIHYIKSERIPSGMMFKKFSYTILGILSGMHPLFTGPWKDKSEEQLSEYLTYLCRTLSEQYSVIFLSRLPGFEDILGPKIFFPHLVFPPLGYQEDQFGGRASLAVLHSLSSQNSPIQSLKQLSAILLESPDPLHCSLGYIFSAALRQKQDNTVLNYFSEIYPLLGCTLYPAIQFTRRHFELPESWHSLAKDENYNEASSILDHDLGIGLFPLLLCPDHSLILNPKYRLYFEMICSLMLKEAHHLGRIFYKMVDIPLGIRIQHAFISLSIGEIDECLDIIKDLKIMGESPLDLWFTSFLASSLSGLLPGSSSLSIDNLPPLDKGILDQIKNPQVRTKSILFHYYLLNSDKEKEDLLKKQISNLDCAMIYEGLKLGKTNNLQFIPNNSLSNYKRIASSPFYFYSNEYFV
ncbi:MAG TPA: hypothetical protein PKA63_05995 [Oligoflexia bacterium]|nr:hypothetical protein [Oligoflexia bacterium]HMP48202.1 hypothetical protein [Oligoflexia bacterium]